MSSNPWTAPTVTSNGVTIPHNDKRWSVKTNGHPTSDGHRWGWIDGIDGSLEWSDDDDTFTEVDAAQAVAEHNGWLDNQEPLELALINAHKVLEAFAKDREKIEANLERALNAEVQAEEEVNKLLARRATQHHEAIAQAFLEAADTVGENNVASILRNLAIDYSAEARS